MSDPTTYKVGDKFTPYQQFDFISIPEPLFRYYDLTPSEKMLYGLLCKYVGKKDYCWPLQTTLANDLNISLSQVRRMLKTLEEKKFIEREVFTHPRRYTRYYIIIHPIFEGKFRNKDIKLISIHAHQLISIDDNEKGSMDGHASLACMDTAKREEKVSEKVRVKSVSKETVLTDENESKLDDLNKGHVDAIVDYWNTRTYTTTHKGKQVLKKADRRIKVLLDRGYNLANMRAFIEWYNNSRNNPQSRLFRNYKTGDWYNFQLPEVLRFSKNQKKMNDSRPSVASILKGIPSLFELFMSGDIEQLNYPKDEVSESFVARISDAWKTYQDLYDSEWMTYKGGDDRLFTKMAMCIEKFYHEYKGKLNFEQGSNPLQTILKLVIYCVTQQPKKYELHWVTTDSFFNKTFVEYLINNGYFTARIIHHEDQTDDETADDYHDSLFDTILYKT